MSRKLHIGGRIQTPGWEIFDALPAPHVDHLGNAKDLSRFPDATFDELYASHVVEHFDYVDELGATLKEWQRVLQPGGKIYVSVPDLDTLARLFLQPETTPDEKFLIMRMIFGGHVDQYDYHVAGLNQDFLAGFLTHAGFVNLQRVNHFGLFRDTSLLMFKGTFISLNVTAEKPGQ